MAAKVHIARRLRRNQTDAERTLWLQPRDRRLCGKFCRQVSIGRYVVDFCCEASRLIIEVDGGQPGVRARENAETAVLKARGHLALRFWNDEVVQNIESVLQAIVDTVSPGPPHPLPLPLQRGEGARLGR